MGLRKTKTPEISVGEFKIIEKGFSSGCVYIRHSSGEGGDFSAKLFEKCIAEFYDKHF